MPKKTKTQILRDEIKKGLLEQLERNGEVGKYFIDLVDDYIRLWDTKNLLIADIESRGVTVESVTSQGYVNTKKNESVSELLKTNAQMLKLLSELGIKANVQAGGGGGVPPNML